MNINELKKLDKQQLIAVIDELAKGLTIDNKYLTKSALSKLILSCINTVKEY